MAGAEQDEQDCGHHEAQDTTGVEHSTSRRVSCPETCHIQLIITISRSAASSACCSGTKQVGVDTNIPVIVKKATAVTTAGSRASMQICSHSGLQASHQHLSIDDHCCHHQNVASEALTVGAPACLDA